MVGGILFIDYLKMTIATSSLSSSQLPYVLVKVLLDPLAMIYRACILIGYIRHASGFHQVFS